MDAWERWRHQRRDFEHHAAQLLYAMKHPPGAASGTKWLPLARHVGWPEYALSTLARIIWRESTGRERAANPTSSARGLLQFMSGWYTGAWGIPAFNPLDAEQNLHAGYHVWRMQGWSPWALTY